MYVLCWYNFKIIFIILVLPLNLSTGCKEMVCVTGVNALVARWRWWELVLSIYNVVGEPLTQSVKISFPSRFARCDRNVLKSKNIVFPGQKHRFPSSSSYGSGMDSEMTQHILFENEQKYFSRLKHADTVALTRAPKNGLLHWKIFHSSLFK